MRYRSRRRHGSLTPRQKELKDKSRRAEFRMQILCFGIGKMFEHGIYGKEDLDPILEFLNGEVFDAACAYDRADEALYKSIQKKERTSPTPPRSQKPTTASRQDQPTKKGKVKK